MTEKRAFDRRQLRSLTVAKAKPKAKPYLIWDAAQRHLALAVRPTGVKSWKVIYARQGRSRWLTLGSADAIDLAAARIMAQEAMLAVAKGKDPAAEKKAERGSGTFAELAAKYVEQYAKRKNKSWRQSEALIRSYALPKWAKLQAASITRDDVKTLMARIAAPITANQVLASVSAVFTWGIKEQHVAINPCKLVDRNPTKSRERVLSESELATFWEAFDDVGVAGAALKMILLSGQRPGECTNMRREHIRDGWWEMPGEPVPSLRWPGTKNGESHRVWLSAPVQQLIGNGTAGFVFCGRRGAPMRQLDATMREICDKLGIKSGATPHDLRRTFSTTVAGLGFGRDALNRITNHKDGGIASVYDRHGYADENRRVMEATAARIMALVEGRAEDGKVVSLRR
jgi:integrase